MRVCVCVCVCVSKYPSAPACTNSKQLVQKYYTSKCVPERPESTLSVPPWTGSLNPVQYSHLNASLFTVSEVEKVIINLPNNKASGSDGVTYETLKSGKSTLCPVLDNIFNICLENGKVPEAWKGALIHRIPKKDNIPDDPSTWRDISLAYYRQFIRYS